MKITTVKNEWLGIILAICGTLGFATKAIFVKLGYMYAVEAETLLALRMSYALPFFILMMIWNKKQASHSTSIAAVLQKKDIVTLVLLGFFGYYLSSYLDFLGLAYISATLERLLLFTYPTFVIILSRIFLQKKIPWRFYPATLLSYIGISVLMLAESKHTGASSNIALGSMLVIASALSYAIYLVMTGEMVKKLGSTRVVAYASTVACILSIGQFLWLKPVSVIFEQPFAVHLIGICLATFSTVLPIWLLAEAIARLGASLTAIISMLGPIFTIGLAVILLGEPMGGLQILGMFSILIGISVATSKPKM